MNRRGRSHGAAQAARGADALEQRPSGVVPASAPGRDPFADDPAFYKLVSSHATDLISVHAFDGTFRFLTPNVERLFGYAPYEVVGSSIYSLVHPEDLSDLVDQHCVQAGTDERRVRYRLRCRNGSYRWVETRVRAERTRTDLDALICFTRDIDDEQRAVQAAQQAEARLRHELELLAATDTLTQLANRRATQHALERELARCARQREPLAVALLDIDHFKHFNDAFGHDTGDRVLVAVAEVLAGQIRECDFAGRWGGEEFLVILSAADAGAGREAAQRICERVRRLFLGLNRGITASIGVAARRPDESAAELVHRADQALYEAKRAGRDRVCLAPG